MGRRTDCLGSLVMHNLNYLRRAFLTSLATAKTLSANERKRVAFEARGLITRASRASNVQAKKDGDTVKFSRQRVRLFGIDAPETAQPCGDLRQPSRRGEQGADQLHGKGFGLAGHGRKSVGRSARCYAASQRGLGAAYEVG
jgi:endonuclease YncB( thermonuclease family)